MLNKLGNDRFCEDCSQAEEWSLVMFGNTVCSGALVPYGSIAPCAGWSKIWSGVKTRDFLAICDPLKVQNESKIRA